MPRLFSLFLLIISALFFCLGCDNIACDTPADLSALTISATDAAITLSWTNSGLNDSDYVNVERMVDGYGYEGFKALPAADTAFTDTEVSQGSTYYYRIRAEKVCPDNAVLYSNYSSAVNLVMVSPCPTPPNAPLVLYATVTLTQIVVTWSNSGIDADQVSLERKVDSDGTYSVYQTLPSAETGFTDTDVTEGHTYYYKIRSLKTCSDSSVLYSDYTEETSVEF